MRHVATNRLRSAVQLLGRLRSRILPGYHAAPVRRLQLVSLVVLLVGMLGTGWWISYQIEERVIRHAVEINSLYIESLIAPLLRDLPPEAEMLPEASRTQLNHLLASTPLGARLDAFVIWGGNGRVLYSTLPSEIGQRYVAHGELAQAFAGALTWELVDSNAEAHAPSRSASATLLAMYSPVTHADTRQIIAVTEFYQAGDDLIEDAATAQQQAWLSIGGVTLLMYLLLAGYIQYASDTIVRQQTELNAQVQQLTELLVQNAQLHERVERAAHRNATLYERVMRRISADLHDGPAQNLGAALLHLDRIAAYHEQHPDQRADQHVAIAQSSLVAAMDEIRAISAGLGAFQLDSMALAEVIEHVIELHERRTQTEVMVLIDDLPEQASPAIKVMLYRVIQEGLNNAFRHGKGVAQRVSVAADADNLRIEVADQGPGFAVDAVIQSNDHMGLAGMRDRVESLGGIFSIQSAPGQGACIRAQLPLRNVKEA